MADVKTEKQKVKENTDNLEEGLKELFVLSQSIVISQDNLKMIMPK